MADWVNYASWYRFCMLWLWTPEFRTPIIVRKTPMKIRPFKEEPTLTKNGWYWKTRPGDTGYDYKTFASNCCHFLSDIYYIDGIEYLCAHYYLNTDLNAEQTARRIKELGWFKPYTATDRETENNPPHTQPHTGSNPIDCP